MLCYDMLCYVIICYNKFVMQTNQIKFIYASNTNISNIRIMNISIIKSFRSKLSMQVPYR